MLYFGVKPEITSQKFLDACLSLIPEDEFETLKSIIENSKPANSSDFFKQWFKFETELKNELVRHRADRQKKDAGKYLRENEYWSSSIIHSAMSAYKSPSIIEAEKLLDMERWRFLDELCAGHYFDFEVLLIYAIKIRILERWGKINTANKEKLLEEALN